MSQPKPSTPTCPQFPHPVAATVTIILILILALATFAWSSLQYATRAALATTSESVASAIRDDITKTKTVNEVAVTAGGVLVGSPSDGQRLIKISSSGRVDATYNAASRTLTLTDAGATCTIALPTQVATVTADCPK